MHFHAFFYIPTTFTTVPSHRVGCRIGSSGTPEKGLLLSVSFLSFKAYIYSLKGGLLAPDLSSGGLKHGLTYPENCSSSKTDLTIQKMNVYFFF